MIGFVYAIESSDLVKIGFSRNPKIRLSTIRGLCSEPCKLLGFVRGTLDDERELHALLGSERRSGEWFCKGKLVSHFLSMLPRHSFDTAEDRCRASAALNITPVALAKQMAGGPRRLARLLTERGDRITSQAVSQWLSVPDCRARDVAAVTGLPLHEIRPDLWLREEAAQ